MAGNPQWKSVSTASSNRFAKNSLEKLQYMGSVKEFDFERENFLKYSH
jgi:hypothetical protein